MDKLATILGKRNLKLVTAESCTGGMISTALTAAAGASSFFDRGFVTYSDNSKQEMLGISQEMLDMYGAVSQQCAAAMATGSLKRSKANISLSVTGIAGPDGGDKLKPVGLVYIAVAITGKQPDVVKCNFSGSRTEVREKTCRRAIELLIQTVNSI